MELDKYAFKMQTYAILRYYLLSSFFFSIMQSPIEIGFESTFI